MNVTEGKEICEGVLEEQFQNARLINRKNLEKLLSDNRNTALGRLFSFGEIKTVEEYREKVPLLEYAFLQPYLERQSNGEKDVVTVYPLHRVLLTSGTSGKQKRFPITRESLRRYGAYICETPDKTLGESGEKQLHTSVFRSANERKETLLSAAYFRYLKENGLYRLNYVGEEFQFKNNPYDVPYVKLRYALAEENMRAVRSIFLYDILLTCKYLEENWERLLFDIKNNVGGFPAVSDARINEIEKVFVEGFSKPILPRLWKKLRFVSGIDSSANMTEKLRKYIGNTPVHYFAYASSEIMAGVATEMDKAVYTLLPNNAYYEFRALKDDRIVDIPKVGEEYELIVSTFSGLYRYPMGDVIKIVGFDGEAPKFEVLGRKGELLNIAGEKIDASTFRMAIETLLKKGYNIEEFAVGTDMDTIPARYAVYIETFEKYEESMGVALDKALRAVSEDYADLRELGMIELPKVYLVPPDFIRNTLSLLYKERHNKPIDILNSNLLNAFYKELEKCR